MSSYIKRIDSQKSPYQWTHTLFNPFKWCIHQTSPCVSCCYWNNTNTMCPKVCGRLTITPICAACWASHSTSDPSLWCYNSFQSSGEGFLWDYRNVSVGISAHSAARTLLNLGTNVGWEVLVHSFQSQEGVSWGSVQVTRGFLHQPWQTMSLWSLCCAQGYCHAGTSLCRLVPRENPTDAAYKHILYNSAPLTLFQLFREDPHKGVMVRFPQACGQIR